MADRVWDSSVSGAVFVHAIPKIYVSGKINFDKGTYSNMAITCTGGFYGYESYLSLYKVNSGSSFNYSSGRKQLGYYEQCRFGARGNKSPISVNIGNGQFSGSTSAQYYLLFECQQSYALAGKNCDTWDSSQRGVAEANFHSALATYPNGSGSEKGRSGNEEQQLLRLRHRGSSGTGSQSKWRK